MADRRSAKQANHGERRTRERAKRGGSANWALVDRETLAYAVTVVASWGGALRLGYTRDGGAYSIGVYGDGEPYTEYIRPNESVEEYLQQLAVDFGGIVGDGSLSGDAAK